MQRLERLLKLLALILGIIKLVLDILRG